jgi:ketosteroid isomerase-like protein
MSQENVELTRAGYEAFRVGNAPAIVGLLDPEIEWVGWSGNDRLPGGGTFRGLAELVTGVFGRMQHTWTAFEFRPETYLDAGDHVIVIGRMWGESRESGVEVDVPFAHVWRVEAGKARRVELYTDTLTVFEALAPVPAR